MSVEQAMMAAVDAYHADTQSHQARFGSAPVRNAGEVKGLLSDFWAKLVAMGAAVNWQVVFQQLWTIIGQLFGGKSVADIIAWLVTKFPKQPSPTPPGPAVG